PFRQQSRCAVGFDYGIWRRADRDRLAQLDPLGRAARAAIQGYREGARTGRRARSDQAAAGMRVRRITLRLSALRLLSRRVPVKNRTIVLPLMPRKNGSRLSPGRDV